ncbi:hypothetical protein D3C85_1590050 [compost metagenome]
MHPIAIDQPGMDVGQVAVKDFVGVFGQLDALELNLAGIVEQAQFDLGGVGREDRKVDPQTIPGGTQRKGQAFTDARGLDMGFGGGRSGRGHEDSCGMASTWAGARVMLSR